MVVNAIAPFEGKLIWVGTPNGGFNQNNEEWKSVEFAIAYTDGKLQERQILFSAFGIDKVNRITNMPLGTLLRVTFQPTAREYNGKWYGKNEVFGITVIQPQAQPQQPAPQYPPQYPVQGTQMPPQTPAYQAPVYQQPVQPAPQGFPAGLTAEDDIPF